MFALPTGMVAAIGADDANPIKTDWAAALTILVFMLPCLAGALLATGYSCRALLFQPEALPESIAN
ncbi:hypothetical protein [Hymenobacter rubidus]|uniref:hypothetical protein n=1 Tax=Hymenobacter rubidus TaxID=1441626 RepID=UPI00191E2C93|nr:hypothetical protein [Hymenobacter rubidus]